MTDLAPWKVRGAVRTLETEIANWDRARETWQTPRKFSSATFRPDGKISEFTCHNPDGSNARQAFVYDDERLIESQFWMDASLRTRVISSYDAHGRLTAANEIGPDGIQRQTETTEYDSSGRRTTVRVLPAAHAELPVMYGVEGTELSYGAPGAVTLTIVYDERERPAEATFRGADQGVVRRIVFSRDHEGRVVSEVVHFGGETPFPLNALRAPEGVQAAESGQLAALMRAVFADQTFSSTTYAYDEKGRLRERTMRMGALSEETTGYEYDDHDNPVIETSNDRSHDMRIDESGSARAGAEARHGQQTRFDYVYDARGNWVERVVWSQTGSAPEFVRSNVERRKITYYDGS
jgi:hypothetical protein